MTNTTANQGNEMTNEQLDQWYENLGRVSEIIREADAAIQPILDICTVLEWAGIEVQY